MKLKRAAAAAMLLIALSCPGKGATGGAASAVPAIDGTFIQTWLCADWDDGRWDAEMQMLGRAGMRYLIFTTCMHRDGAGPQVVSYPSGIAPSDHPWVVERCLRSAQKHGMKVFLGINFDSAWWHSPTSQWLDSAMTRGNQIASELTALYKKRYPDAMHGWYWVWEVDNLNWHTAERREALSAALRSTIAHISRITPSMPLMLSPFINSRVGADAQGYADMWREVFAMSHLRPGDIFCPQDCVGAGGLTLDDEPAWMQALSQAAATCPGLRFWINAETFTPDARPAPIARIRQQLHTASRWADRIMSFSFCHYNSPFGDGAQSYTDYMQYIHPHNK